MPPALESPRGEAVEFNAWRCSSVTVPVHSEPASVLAAVCDAIWVCVELAGICGDDGRGRPPLRDVGYVHWLPIL